MKSKIRKRREADAVCVKCKSPDWEYLGRVSYIEDGKHQFKCNSCGHDWQYGRGDSKFTELI